MTETPTAFPSSRDDIGSIDAAALSRLTLLADPTALTDWRAIAASETANAKQCEADARLCIDAAHDADDRGWSTVAALWRDLADQACAMGIHHARAARIAIAEVTAIRERCAPRERAMLVRLAVCPAVAS